MPSATILNLLAICCRPKSSTCPLAPFLVWSVSPLVQMKSEKFFTFGGINRAGKGIAGLIYKSFFHFPWCFLRLPR